jgi:hypothetical protein
VFAKSQKMVSTQPNITHEQLGQISAPTLVFACDGDMISLEHTSALYNAIPNSELAARAGESHALLWKARSGESTRSRFPRKDPPKTFMPLKRQSGADHVQEKASR